MSILYPDYYFKKVTDIPIKLYIKERITTIVFDLDNTLVSNKYILTKELKEYIKEIKKNNIDIYILSNTPFNKKIQKISKNLSINYINKALKPWPIGFNKLKKLYKIDNEKTVMIGDQIFTDVLGGNINKFKTILIDPIDRKEFILTRIKRPLERIIIKNYLKKVNK
ncbi:MAG: YqeG family HAD IIIA-type phosphatase [Clostridia bacterium]